jgi:glycosyltransferase involved in cell wall biosynthesis
VEGIEMARYLELVRPAQRIYDAHNAEFLLQQRASDTAASATAKLYSRLQWQRLARFERAVVRSSRLSLAVSEHDANQLLALANGCARVAVVPNGIDVAAYTFRQPREHDAPNVLFLGKLDYRPNAEAIQWFLDAVFDRLTDARVFAVGGAPPAWLIKRGQLNDRIAVTGYVHDERPYLERAALLVLPTRAAGGARLKALVAMASGVPILSTRLGMEGLDAEPGRHFWCAETSEQWVAAVDRLLRDASLRQRLAREARVLVEHTYDWSAIRPALGAAYARFAR